MSGESFQALVSITDSLFEENFAVDGAGLYISDSSLTVTGTVFESNSATGGFGGGRGGAASVVSGGVAEFTACNFTGNTAWAGAGGEARNCCTVYGM